MQNANEVIEKIEKMKQVAVDLMSKIETRASLTNGWVLPAEATGQLIMGAFLEQASKLVGEHIATAEPNKIQIEEQKKIVLA